MKKGFLLFPVVVILLQLTSCAIHRKFPYICFRKECVLGQLGYYSAKESFKRAKINASVRKHKRMVKRNIRQGRKGLDPPYDLVKEKKKADSLTYNGGFSGICKEIRIIFVKASQKDSITVNYQFDEKDLSPEGKKIIKELIERSGAALVNEVVVVNCHKRNVLSEHEALWMDERVRKIKKYLKSLDVSENKVHVDE